ncbi:hypothetical protein OPV22_024692 [Ensete ventricosum]|uniref:FAD linked oxidase N-terminal domain-containing protein n=1 Tax=Ensete ventricosum TaxID=4639 RepID=A0AAV8QAU4_ENSVE|nr:hypothetical protein OPV22_024692 [Ensete ventricosum]
MAATTGSEEEMLATARRLSVIYTGVAIQTPMRWNSERIGWDIIVKIERFRLEMAWKEELASNDCSITGRLGGNLVGSGIHGLGLQYKSVAFLQVKTCSVSSIDDYSL